MALLLEAVTHDAYTPIIALGIVVLLLGEWMHDYCRHKAEDKQLSALAEIKKLLEKK